MKNYILYHAQRYPDMEPQDYVKLLYQSEFGGSHFIADEAQALAHLQQEITQLPEYSPHEENPFEPVGCGMVRMYLTQTLLRMVRPEIINRMAILSAHAKRGSLGHLRQKAQLVQRLAEEGKISLDSAAFAAYWEQYEQSGCPSVHHSEAYRAAHTPAYRLITRRAARYFPAICLCEQLLRSRRRHIAIAIEGCAGGGKSTLGRYLSRLYDCNLYHMDDFFLPADKRTPQRLQQIGGNIDSARFAKEVASHIHHDTPFCYRQYSCASDSFRRTVFVTPKRLHIVEGSYSMHPLYRRIYQGAIFVDVNPTEQRRRILTRCGPQRAEKYFSLWIPMEQRYQTQTHVREQCDVILDCSK